MLFEFNPFENPDEDSSVKPLEVSNRILRDIWFGRNFRSLGISREKFSLYWEKILSTYNDNRYHNKYHAIDVTVQMDRLIDLIGYPFEEYEIFALIVGMLGHDAAHPGLTNDYIALYGPKLYQDVQSSYLEHYHLKVTNSIIDEVGLLESVEPTIANNIRGIIEILILGTDPKTTKHIAARRKSSLTVDRVYQIFGKCADVASSCRNIEISKEWSRRVIDEFQALGSTTGHTELPLCGPDVNFPESQVGFLDFYVLPLLRSANYLFQEKLVKLVNQVESNLRYWEEQL